MLEILSLESIFPSLPVYESSDSEEEESAPVQNIPETYKSVYRDSSPEPGCSGLSTRGPTTSGITSRPTTSGFVGPSTSGRNTSGISSAKTTTIERIYPQLNSDSD